MPGHLRTRGCELKENVHQSFGEYKGVLNGFIYGEYDPLHARMLLRFFSLKGLK